MYVYKRLLGFLIPSLVPLFCLDHSLEPSASTRKLLLNGIMIKTLNNVLDRSRHVYYGWWLFFAACLIMFSSGTAGVSLTSLFVKPVTEEFGWSRGLISGAISLGTFMGGLVAPFIGRIIDQKGARVILTVGCLMQGISLIGLSMTRNIWSLYLCICLARVNFSSLVIVGAPTAVSNWFVAKRAKLLSFLIIADRVSMATLSPLAQWMIITAGWRVAWSVLGSICIIIGVIPAFVLIRRAPEDYGLLPDGVRKNSTMQDQDAYQSPSGKTDELSFTDALKTRALWILMAVQFMVGMVATGLGIHRIPYLSDRGIDESSLSGILILIAIGMILGAYFWATLTTKLRGNIVISMNLFGMAFTVLFLMNVNSAELAYIYAFLDGLMISGSQTLMLVVMANYFGRGILGRIRGITTPVWNAGFALGPLFAGLVYDFNDSYTFAFITFIVLAFVAGILASGAQKPKVY